MVTRFSCLKSIILTPTPWQSPAHVAGEQEAKSSKIILLAKTKHNKKSIRQDALLRAHQLQHDLTTVLLQEWHGARPPGRSRSHRACSSGPRFRQGMYFLMTFSIRNAFLTIQWKYHHLSCNKFPGLFYNLLKNIFNRLFHQFYTTSGWLGIRHTNTIKFLLTFDFFYVHSAYSPLPPSTTRKPRITFCGRAESLGWESCLRHWFCFLNHRMRAVTPTLQDCGN